MSNITVESLPKIEQDWSAHYKTVAELLAALGTELRSSWSKVDELTAELKKAAEGKAKAVDPMSDAERRALMQDIDFKREQIITLNKNVDEVKEQMKYYDALLSQLQERVGIPESDLLTDYLRIVESKFKEKYDLAIAERGSKNISEYALTGVTIGYHLIYAAKTAWDSALREAKNVLENEKESIDAKPAS